MEESKTTTILIAVEKSSQITEQQLREYLNVPITRIDLNSSPKGWRVQLDSTTANSLLEKGEDTLNNWKMNFAENDPYCTIYIKGITDKFEEADLISALSVEGRICMASIPRDPISRKPKGMSFVRFNRKEDALRAAEKNATLTVNGIALECTKYDGKTKEVVNESAKFRNIPDEFEYGDVYNLFSEFGNVADLKIDKENSTGIVSYSTSGSVQKAVQSLNGKPIGSKVFFCNAAEDKKRSNTYSSLFVGNVDPNIKEDEIREVFSEHGEIESLLWPTRKVKNDKGEYIDIRKHHIFISFKNPKDASNVIKEMDTKVYWGRALDINYYDPEAKRGHTEKQTAPATQANPNLLQEFASAMFSVMTQFSNINMRSRGGHPSSGTGYRGGTQQYGRGTRGSTRGAPRGSTRGGRGAPRGAPGHFQVRSQYEQPKPMMGPPIGMTPIGGMMSPMSSIPPISQSTGVHAYSHIDSKMSQSAHPMQSQMIQPVAQHPSHLHEAQDETDEVLSYSIDEIPSHENEIGTYLYNKIDAIHGTEMAGRITGMFLDLPADEIYQIIHDQETYDKYLSDAEELIRSENENKDDK